MLSTTMTITPSKKKEKLTQVGCLRGGHGDWITSIGILQNIPDRIVSTSRDKTLLIWKIQRDPELGITGVPFQRLTGHSHFISDIATTPDSQFCLTGSWDKTLRLWDLTKNKCTQIFNGHTNDVLGVGFSWDNRQIVSGSRDKTIKLWNTLGECKYVMSSHTQWVSSVAITAPVPNLDTKIFSTSWDTTLKMWNAQTFQVDETFESHTNAILCMAISPDASLCATGSKDCTIVLWDMYNKKKIWTIRGLAGEVRALTFSPNHYRLCAAVDSGICVYDLEDKVLLAEENFDNIIVSASGTSKPAPKPQILCLKWSTDGNILFAGYSDGQIRCWKFTSVPTYKVNYDDEDD